MSRATGIVDFLAHCGPYTRRPIGVEAPGLRGLLEPFEVARVFAGRLEALWFENPHDANRIAESRPADSLVTPVPVLDPTVASWREELDRLSARGDLKLVRLLPGHGNYALTHADPLFEALARRNVIAQVVTAFDDPRRQHPLARVADVPAAAVLDAALRHPRLRVLLSGAGGPALVSLASRLPATGNLWADTADADGVGTLLSLTKTPWRDRLVFGSNAPLFIPAAGFARIVNDLEDDDVERILVGNAAALLG